MQTLLTDSPEEAAAILNSGGIVAFPTETVYGLGAAITRAEAIRQVFQAKGRPADNPLIVHVSRLEQLEEVAREINPAAQKLIARFLPGPLTLVLKKSPLIPDSVTAGLDTVGVRCPANMVARAFLSHCSTPVAAPSANLSGLPSATSWETVLKDLDGKIHCILRGKPSSIGLESTIVDCSVPEPRLLRAGAITLEQLQEVLPEVRAEKEANDGMPPKSPGLKYPHYAPSASIILCTPDEPTTPRPRSAFIGLTRQAGEWETEKICRNLEEYGRELFSFFRHCDSEGISFIYCELPSREGLGRAIRDRLLRAAGEE
ncbi:MAG: L-threonylcarbamoyladenylate synthase [Chlorobiaceae bacterium]